MEVCCLPFWGPLIFCGRRVTGRRCLAAMPQARTGAITELLYKLSPVRNVAILQAQGFLMNQFNLIEKI